MAERIVDMVIENHDFTAKPCTTADVPLPGGDAEVLASDLTGVCDVQAERLVRLYGAEAPGLLRDSGCDELKLGILPIVSSF